MNKTGNVERRGSKHRLFYELRCDGCTRTKWVTGDRVVGATCAHCTGAKGRRPDDLVVDLRTNKWYVRMVGSAHMLPQWAAGPPEAPCWVGGEKIQFVGPEPRDVPPPAAKSFDTRNEALRWIELRKKYLEEEGRTNGHYAAVRF